MAASPVTILDIVNKILARLREGEVTDVTDSTYSRMLVNLINDAKREVEDAFNWSVLKKTIDVTTVASTSTIVVDDTAGNDTNTRSRILEVYDSTNDCYLIQRTRDEIRRFAFDDNAEQEPTYYAIDGFDSDENVKIELHHTPADAYVLKITAIVPQEDLELAESKISVPWRPVYLRALTLALRERGDDEGYGFGEAFQEYMIALNDAIAYEQQHTY